MACSVYGAQHLLDALYRCGEADYALTLLTATHNRGWYHMIESGSTMTWEAWDWTYKNNLDWNHAWGAAPANIIVRRLIGVRPLEPGFSKILIQPQPGSLRQASCKVPTIRGPVFVSFENDPEKAFVLKIEIPVNTTARVGLPYNGDGQPDIILDGKKCAGQPEGKFLFIDVNDGTHVRTLG
ncbi:MAG: alpha-L-rhamnosidase C-terminal domain-containing protein [Kiritimatiellales bacterium]|nr:alpha-L-rhamnosidase C-terminal domain-containing protein [Kiritimatiellales bacterium]